MSLRWRWCLVVVLAATVLGGFLPRTALASESAPSSVPVLSAPFSLLPGTGCADASCGKGAPAPAIPAPSIAALAVALAGVLVLAAVGRARRLPPNASTLPPGVTSALFRPPQFSSFGLT